MYEFILYQLVWNRANESIDPIKSQTEPHSKVATPSVKNTNAKATNFFPFCTIGISIYQKSILPYFIIPYLFTPSFFPFGAFQTDGQRKFFTPCYPSFFFPERAGPYPQAQLYWAGRTMGWMAE
jgi:hypothetical protein